VGTRRSPSGLPFDHPLPSIEGLDADFGEHLGDRRVEGLVNAHAQSHGDQSPRRPHPPADRVGRRGADEQMGDPSRFRGGLWLQHGGHPSGIEALAVGARTETIGKFKGILSITGPSYSPLWPLTVEAGTLGAFAWAGRQSRCKRARRRSKWGGAERGSRLCGSRRPPWGRGSLPRLSPGRFGADVELFRLFGFAIEPQRLLDEDLFSQPAGGALSVRASLRNALDGSLRTAEKSGRLTQVVLKVDLDPANPRTNPVREAIVDLAFGSGGKAKRGALALASQLSRAMDERSPDCLFLVAAYRQRDLDERRVALWIFPQDEAFRFTPGQDDNDIELLTDIFSRTSALRKMALFAGKNLDTHFLDGLVLDYQTGRADDVAGFWIRRFLESQLAITPAAGTKVLSDALKRAAEADLSAEQHRQVHAAALAVHTMPQTHWSLEQVANEFLSGKASQVFLASAENDATRTSVFKLDREALQRGLSFRNFRLLDNVWVSAPIDQVGEGKRVQLETQETDGEGPAERLRLEADVIQDKLASRRV
jgi:hypothetical protein